MRRKAYDLPILCLAEISVFFLHVNSKACGSLVVKVMDSWEVCHEFERVIAENPSWEVDQFTPNMSKLKHSPVEVVWKLGEEGCQP
ncbi:hypothetical protein TNCV_640751 [Trichonephila clavipes]|nr:hypothetical protein TNCV_640751 [Trichonephila clavipes]